VTVTGPVVDGFSPNRGRSRPRTSAASRLRALREQWERRTAPSATPGDAEPAGSVSG
jgi:hypothetical protein